MPRRLGGSKSYAVFSLILSVETGQNFCYSGYLCYTTITITAEHYTEYYGFPTDQVSVQLEYPYWCQPPILLWLPSVHQQRSRGFHPFPQAMTGEHSWRRPTSSPLCELSFPGFPQQHQYSHEARRNAFVLAVPNNSGYHSAVSKA